MGRDRNEGYRKDSKQKRGGSSAGDERDSERRSRAHMSERAIKTHDIRNNEAQRQIRELRSRY